MNTCLSMIYLKLNQIDSRHIRLVFMLLTLIAGGSIFVLPIAGDVGG